MTTTHVPILGDLDMHLIAEGSHMRLYDVLGAHVRTMGGVTGTTFAVWAPNARRASVVGDFNNWDGRVHRMYQRRECGVWEIFIPGVGAGARVELDLLGIMATRARITGSTLRARDIEEKAAVASGVRRDLLGPLADGELTVPVLSTFPLDRAADAYERFAAGSKLGKIILDCSN